MSKKKRAHKVSIRKKGWKEIVLAESKREKDLTELVLDHTIHLIRASCPKCRNDRLIASIFAIPLYPIEMERQTDPR